MNFATAINEESKKTFTENGQEALNTTGNAVLDLFGTIGSLRDADDLRVQTLFAEAYKEDPLLATKCLFYARDIRGGLGERKVFRTLLKYAAKMHPECIRPNIPLIGIFGRYDDLYELIDTPLENDMWAYMKIVFESDLKSMEDKEPCTLLAKWMKTSKTTVKETRRLGLLTAKKLGMQEREYKRKLHALREYLKVVEVDMAARRWSNIEYSKLPSRAIRKYVAAFKRHDNDRYLKWIESIKKGESKVNASTLYPYDLIERYFNLNSIYNSFGNYDELVEAQWKALPDYVGKGVNAMVIADTSGSMFCATSGGKKGRPAMSAIGLALYFAEHNTGAYHNLWMSFSRDSRIQTVKGETLLQKLRNIDYHNWSNDTNIELAFDKILDIAIKHRVPRDEMIKSLIIISDMEFNQCTERSSRTWTFYDNMYEKYRDAGYDLPNIVFWNVDSRQNVFHADSKRKGVQLCSGQSAATFKQLLESIGKTPVEMMLKVLNQERYSVISIDKNQI